MIDGLAANNQLGVCEEEVADVVAVVTPRVAELGARDVGAVGVAVDAAAELAPRAVLLASPYILRLPERIDLVVGRQVVVVCGKVLHQRSLVHATARSARGAAFHKGRELDARAAIVVFRIPRHEAWEDDVDVQEVDHVARSIEQDLALLSKLDGRVKWLRERLTCEFSVLLVHASNVRFRRRSSQILVDAAVSVNVVRNARHLSSIMRTQSDSW